MDVPIGIRLGQAIASLGYDPTLCWGMEGISRLAIDTRTTYDIYRVSGILGMSKSRLGNVSVAGNGRDSLKVSVYGRENGDEMERVAADLSDALGMPVRVVLERP